MPFSPYDPDPDELAQREGLPLPPAPSVPPDVAGFVSGAPPARGPSLDPRVAAFASQYRGPSADDLRRAQARDRLDALTSHIGDSFTRAASLMRGQDPGQFQALAPTGARDVEAQQKFGRDAATEGREQQRFTRQQNRDDLLDKKTQQDIDTGALTLRDRKTEDAEKLDPNSPRSQFATTLYAKLVGKPPPAGTTAAQIERMLPLAEKMWQAEEQKQWRLQTAHDRATAKADGDLDKKLGLFRDALDPNKQRAGTLGADQARANKADNLLALTANGDNLDPRQMEEFAIGLQSLLSGGSGGSSHEVEALLPKTLGGKVANLKEWLTGNPTGTEQQAFVRRMRDTVERERDMAHERIHTAQAARVGSFPDLRKRHPEEFNSVLQSYGFDPKEFDDSGQHHAAPKVGAPAAAPSLPPVPAGKMRVRNQKTGATAIAPKASAAAPGWEIVS